MTYCNFPFPSRQASDLTERASPGQRRAIMEPLGELNRRWDDLNKGINNRMKELENALLRLGQFQHALNELLIWIERTDKTLDTLKPVFGDPQVIEVELAKLKVMVNDIQAHQSSVDTLNDAGRQIIESEKGSREAGDTQQKLNELNTKWNNLLGKAEGRQVELEDALREASVLAQEAETLQKQQQAAAAVAAAQYQLDQKKGSGGVAVGPAMPQSQTTVEENGSGAAADQAARRPVAGQVRTNQPLHKDNSGEWVNLTFNRKHSYSSC